MPLCPPRVTRLGCYAEKDTRPDIGPALVWILTGKVANNSAARDCFIHDGEWLHADRRCSMQRGGQAHDELTSLTAARTRCRYAPAVQLHKVANEAQADPHPAV